MVELLMVLLCYNPEINSVKQHYIEENKIAFVTTNNPKEKCFYTEVLAASPLGSALRASPLSL